MTRNGRRPSHFAGLVRGVGSHHGLADHELDELMQAVRVRLWRVRCFACTWPATIARRSPTGWAGKPLHDLELRLKNDS